MSSDSPPGPSEAGPRTGSARSGSQALALPQLRELARQQGGRCRYCTEPFGRDRKSVLDLERPLWAGGRQTAENRCAACRRCKDEKGYLDAETFLRLRADPNALALERVRAEHLARQAEEEAPLSLPRPRPGVAEQAWETGNDGLGC